MNKTVLNTKRSSVKKIIKPSLTEVLNISNYWIYQIIKLIVWPLTIRF